MSMSSSDVISFSFCQVSDLNLDSGASQNLHMSPAQRKQRADEAIEAFAAAMQKAKEKAVDAIIVPGNLFQLESVTTSTLLNVQKIFAELGDLPVFVAPGANDPLFNDSLYDESALEATGLEQWSKNVHIFSSDLAQSFTLAGKESVKITGIGLTKKGRRSTPYLPKLADADRVAINILLLPLGLADTKGDEPLSAANIKSRAYSYVAFSGFRNEVLLKDAEGNIVAGTSGSFIGQTERELGPRHAFFGTLTKQIRGGLEVNLERAEFDPRRIVACDFDIADLPTEKLKGALTEAMKASGARSQVDILLLNLFGFYQSGEKIDLLSDEMKQEYFHLRVMDNTRPNFLQTMAEQNAIEKKFVAILNELKEKAEQEEGSAKAEQLRVLDDALYFGMEAIREGKVTIRDAN